MELKGNTFLKWFWKEKIIEKEKNVIFAERAFFINSAARWFIIEEKSGRLSPKKKNTYTKYLKQYIKEEIDLCWQDGKISIKKGHEDTKEGIINEQEKDNKEI